MGTPSPVSPLNPDRGLHLLAQEALADFDEAVGASVTKRLGVPFPLRAYLLFFGLYGRDKRDTPSLSRSNSGSL